MRNEERTERALRGCPTGRRRPGRARSRRTRRPRGSGTRTGGRTRTGRGRAAPSRVHSARASAGARRTSTTRPLRLVRGDTSPRRHMARNAFARDERSKLSIATRVLGLIADRTTSRSPIFSRATRADLVRCVAGRDERRASRERERNRAEAVLAKAQPEQREEREHRREPHVQHRGAADAERRREVHRRRAREGHPREPLDAVLGLVGPRACALSPARDDDDPRTPSTRLPRRARRGGTARCRTSRSASRSATPRSASGPRLRAARLRSSGSRHATTRPPRRRSARARRERGPRAARRPFALAEHHRDDHDDGGERVEHVRAGMRVEYRQCESAERRPVASRSSRAPGCTIMASANTASGTDAT